MRRIEDLLARLKASCAGVRLQGSKANDPTASALYAVLMGLLPVLGIHAVEMLLTQENGAHVNSVLSVSGLLILTPAVALILVRKGLVWSAGIVYLTGLWLSYTLIILFSGGLHHVGVAMYIVLPVSAAWLFGYRAALLAAAACFGSAAVMAGLETSSNRLLQYFQTRPVGTWFVLLECTVIGVVPVSVVVSSLRRALKASQVAEAELKRNQYKNLKKQKLESVGVLASGIAHDFNNLLAGVLAQAELVEQELPVGSSTVDEVRRIEMLASRGCEIVRELMLYAADDSTDFAPVNLSRIVAEMMELLKVLVSKHATLNVELGEVPAIAGNATQLRRAVMNLVINAFEALEEQDGVVTVRTSFINAEGAAIPRGVERSQSGYVMLTVADTGPGLSEEQKSRIFDPFFTTKFIGRGLGLAVVQGVVLTHGGDITLEGTSGHGTTFEVFFPCASRLENQQGKIETRTSSEHLGRSKEKEFARRPENLMRRMIEIGNHPKIFSNEARSTHMPEKMRTDIELLFSMLETRRNDNSAMVQQNLHDIYLAQQTAVIESAEQKRQLRAATTITRFLSSGATLRWGNQGWQMGSPGVLLSLQNIKQLKELGFLLPKLDAEQETERANAFVHDLLSDQGIENLDAVSRRAFRSNQSRAYFEYLNELRKLYQQHSTLRDGRVSYPALVREKARLVYNFMWLYLAGLLQFLGIHEQLRQRLAQSSLQVVGSLIG